MLLGLSQNIEAYQTEVQLAQKLRVTDGFLRLREIMRWDVLISLNRQFLFSHIVKREFQRNNTTGFPNESKFFDNEKNEIEF